MIYLSTAFLLSAKVDYKYLLIPDFVLMATKLYTIIYGCVKLTYAQQIGILSEMSTIESIVESFLFALFLAVLFVGKMSHGKVLPNFSIVCLRLLIFCFPATVAFEIARLVIATELHQYPFIIAFNFVKGVLNEAFLDFPYFLLVLTVCFTKNNVFGREYEAQKNLSI